MNEVRRRTLCARIWSVALAALLLSAVGRAAPIPLVAPAPEEVAIKPMVVTDVRPDWQRKKKILSLNRMACDFAIVRWGDKLTTPAPVQAVAERLPRFLDDAHRDKPVKITWFTIHTNRRAPSSTKDILEKGLVYDALHAMECRKGSEIVSGVDDALLVPPMTVIDIVVDVDGRSFAGRAVGRLADLTVAPARLVDEAMSMLAKSINEDAPNDTPCDRLKKARHASPKVSFYAKSYKEYCVRKP